jgi:hypothetical protein
MTAKLSAAQRNDNYTAAVAETLRAERAAAGLTIPELADRAGMVAVTLQRVLKAERDITVAQLAALAPVLGMTPSKLLAEDVSGHVIPQVGSVVGHVSPHPGWSRNSPWGRRCVVAWWVLLAVHADLRPTVGPGRER